MKNQFSLVKTLFVLCLFQISIEMSAQSQSTMLPVAGNNNANPKGSCKIINFTSPTQPQTIGLPYSTFTYNNGIPGGNPHVEGQLALSDIPLYDAYVGQHPMFAQTVVNDADGNLLFFIVDNNIYNRYGVAMIDV